VEKLKHSTCRRWDPYVVWKILLREHPVHDLDPAGSCGRIDRCTVAEFCEAIVEYPDYLQDALLVIAHAKGPEAAVHALDGAVREQLFGRDGQLSMAVECGGGEPPP